MVGALLAVSMIRTRFPSLHSGDSTSSQSATGSANYPTSLYLLHADTPLTIACNQSAIVTASLLAKHIAMQERIDHLRGKVLGSAPARRRVVGVTLLGHIYRPRSLTTVSSGIVSLV